MDPLASSIVVEWQLSCKLSKEEDALLACAFYLSVTTTKVHAQYHIILWVFPGCSIPRPPGHVDEDQNLATLLQVEWLRASLAQSEKG
jgi:hypothetical protein